MPAKGQKSVTISNATYKLARRQAKRNGTSVAQFVTDLIENATRGEVKSS